MSENWTREQMVAAYGEAGADAMRKLSDAYARIEELEAALLGVTESIDRHFQERGESYDLSDAHAMASAALKGDEAK